MFNISRERKWEEKTIFPEERPTQLINQMLHTKQHSKGTETRIAIPDSFFESCFPACNVMSYDFGAHYTKIHICTCSRWVISYFQIYDQQTNLQHNMINILIIFSVKCIFIYRLKISCICFSLFLECCTSNSAYKYVTGAKSLFRREREKSSVLSTIKLLHQAEPFP